MKKQNLRKKALKTNKGITLVALIITIIVLLILAVVTIRAVQGDGIIQYAKNSKSETIKAQQKEEIMLALNEWKLAKHTVPGATFAEVMADKIEGATVTANADGSVKVTFRETAYNVTEAGVITEIEVEEDPEDDGDDEELAKGEIVTGSVVTLTETTAEGKTLTAKIPVGFCVVKDVEDETTGETDINNIENGLVISDVPNDDLDNSAKGNQFVWIPVDIANFHAVEGFKKDSRDSMLADCKEAGSGEEAGSPLKDYNVVGTDESKAMYASVEANGGFYIARFEAGIEGTTTPITEEEDAPTEEDFTSKNVELVSKKDVAVWNYIPWGGTTAAEASDTLQGNDNEYGAVKVARSMSTNNSYSCTSTLCYGVQWDAVMNFIDPNYINIPGGNEEETVAANSFVRNSTGKGNYSGNLALAGSESNYQVNHIYDLGGNVIEWTMEARGTGERVYRGGAYNLLGSRHPASYRTSYNPDYSYEYVGFRVALYL